MGLTGRVMHVVKSAVSEAADGSTDYGMAPVEFGDTVVPARVAYVIEGSDGSPSLEILFEIREGQPVCVDVHIEASADGRGIRTGDLNALPGLDRLAEDMFLEFAIKKPDPDKPFDWFIRGQQERKTARRDVHTRGDAELKEVARVYRENVDARPLEAVVAYLGNCSRRTASRRIDQARAKGLLPPTTQGKRKA